MKPAPRLSLFAGKGGVGKTSCAAAFALGRAAAGERVLVVSTDPAHSLGDALETELGAKPVALDVRKGAVFAAEIDADRALQRWLRVRHDALATAAERGTYLDSEDIEKLLRLSLPGVDELAGLLEVRRLSLAGRYDRVVVDTAPSGHTLRLLQTPDTLRRIAAVFATMEAKHHALRAALAGRAARADAVDEVIAGIDADGRALSAWLTDPESCALTWVLLPEELSVRETVDGVRALDALGVPIDAFWVNRVLTDPTPGCAHCAARARAESRALHELDRALPDRTVRLLPELADEPRGLRALRALDRANARLPAASAARARTRRATHAPAWTALSPPGVELVVVGGKGGVGKTTVACALALALARERPARRVLLLSVDPAHSLGDALAQPLGDRERPVAGAPDNLRAREMDAPAEFARRRERYRDEVDAVFDALRGGSALDASYDRAVVRDLIDLSPPGLDELFAMLSVLEALEPGARGRRRYDAVVLDTAPTGHALRLLDLPDAALEWVHALLSVLLKYRAVARLSDAARELLTAARDLRALIALLRDGHRAIFVPVTRAAALPRVETVRLLDALAARGIAAPSLVVNAATPPDCPRCTAAAARESHERASLLESLGSRGTAPCVMLVAPAREPPPRGVRELTLWSAGIEVTRLEPREESREKTSRKAVGTPPRRRARGDVRVLRRTR